MQVASASCAVDDCGNPEEGGILEFRVAACLAPCLSVGVSLHVPRTSFSSQRLRPTRPHRPSVPLSDCCPLRHCHWPLLLPLHLPMPPMSWTPKMRGAGSLSRRRLAHAARPSCWGFVHSGFPRPPALPRRRASPPPPARWWRTTTRTRTRRRTRRRRQHQPGGQEAGRNARQSGPARHRPPPLRWRTRRPRSSSASSSTRELSPTGPCLPLPRHCRRRLRPPRLHRPRAQRCARRAKARALRWRRAQTCPG
jgi:hypothetical protein